MAGFRRNVGNDTPTIAIVGAGALGSVFAAALLEAGNAVTLLGRRAIPDITVCEPPCQVHQAALRVETNPAVVSCSEFVLVLVKAYDTEVAIQGIAPHLRRDATVLTLQNGLGNVDRIRAQLPDSQQVLAGVTSQAARRVSPGLVLHSGVGPTMVGYGTNAQRTVAEQLAVIFNESGLPAAATGEIDRFVWQKVAVNAAVNGPTAITGLPNGDMLKSVELREATESLAEEAAAVAAAHGYDLGPIHKVLHDTLNATAENRSSMLQDIDAGRRTEVDAIYGSLLAAGRERGLALPALTVIDALVRSISRRERLEEES